MPALSIIALDTATPQLRAPASGDTYAAPRAMEITPVALTGSTATSSLAITQTWNTSGTPTALQMNVTDTASNAASLLMDLRVGGTSRLSVDKTGAVVISDGTSALTIDSTNGATTFSQTPQMIFQTSNALLMRHGNSDALGIRAVSGAVDPKLDFLNTSNALQVRLTTDAANILAQRNGVNAQAFRVYNTFTDASNYERGFIRYSSNQLEIGHEAAGTGSGDRLIVIRRPNAGTVLDVIGSATICARIGTSGGAFASGVGLGSNGANPDIFLFRRAANIGSITGNIGGTTGASLEFIEQTAPAAPATNGVYIYAQDNGAGKTQLMALFATGAAQQIAIEP